MFRTLLSLENARRDRGERNETISRDGSLQDSKSVKNGYESVEAAQRDKGDEYSGFRYILWTKKIDLCKVNPRSILQAKNYIFVLLAKQKNPNNLLSGTLAKQDIQINNSLH